MTENFNPLRNVRVGSTFHRESGDFKPTVIDRKVTAVIAEKHKEDTLSGSSKYVNSEYNNEGSVSLAGDFDLLKGIFDVKASVSGFFGHTSRAAARRTEVSYNTSIVGGDEFLDLAKLSVADLINSLKQNVKNGVLDVLEKYLKARDRFKEKGAQSSEMREWLERIDRFKRDNGDGIVVAVVWGGIGSVTLTIDDESDSTEKRYGGDAKLEAGVGVPYVGGLNVSVGVQFKGNTLKSSKDVRMKVISSVNGSCVEAQVDKWRDAFENKAYNDVINAKPADFVIQRQPDLPPPSVLPFEKPADDSKTTALLARLESKNSFAEFAEASAYLRARTQDKSLTSNKFGERKNEKLDLFELRRLAKNIKNNGISTMEGEDDARPFSIRSMGDKRHKRETGNVQYVALGAKIAKWSDLFPWLATGYANPLNDDLPSARLIVKKRCLLQDALTLSDIYYTVASGKRNLSFCNIANCSSVAKQFLKMAERLARSFDSISIGEILDNLDTTCLRIYATWDDIKFLRNAELGLGLVIKDKSGETYTLKYDEARPHFHNRIANVGFRTEQTHFDVPNYDEFSKVPKLVPLLGGESEIYAFGPGIMLLKNATKEECTFTSVTGYSTASANVVDLPILFTVNANKKCLENTKLKLELHAIPLSAADNNWLGRSYGKSLSSMNSLGENTEKALKNLENAGVYNLTEGQWAENWNPSVGYGNSSFAAQYIGVIKCPENMPF